MMDQLYFLWFFNTHLNIYNIFTTLVLFFLSLFFCYIFVTWHVCVIMVHTDIYTPPPPPIWHCFAHTDNLLTSSWTNYIFPNIKHWQLFLSMKGLHLKSDICTFLTNASFIIFFLTTQKGLNLTKSVQGIRAFSMHIFVSILSIPLHIIFSAFSVYLSALAVPLFTGACLLPMYLPDNKLSPWHFCPSVCIFFHIFLVDNPMKFLSIILF